VPTPTGNHFPRETDISQEKQIFSQNGPFILDHNSIHGNKEVTVIVSPNCSRTKASSTPHCYLGHLVFRQLKRIHMPPAEREGIADISRKKEGIAESMFPSQC
jgi:hypothetical protein